jgi:hypothetical protein
MQFCPLLQIHVSLKDAAAITSCFRPRYISPAGFIAAAATKTMVDQEEESLVGNTRSGRGRPKSPSGVPR